MISAALAILETDEQRDLLAEFYKHNKKRLYRIAFSKLHNRESAEDAVQEAFLRLASMGGRFFALSGKERAVFANVVVRNVAVDMFKKESELETDELCDDIANAAENPPEEEMLYKFTEKRLVEIVRGLPPLQRDVMYLKAVRGMSVHEIAALLSVSENVVRQRLFLARKAIREVMKKGEI